MRWRQTRTKRPEQRFLKLHPGTTPKMDDETRATYTTLCDMVGVYKGKDAGNFDPLRKAVKEDPAGHYLMDHVGATQELADYLADTVQKFNIVWEHGTWTATRLSTEQVLRKFPVNREALGEYQDTTALAALDRVTVKLYQAIQSMYQEAPKHVLESIIS
jgi:hypothetical protein